MAVITCKASVRPCVAGLNAALALVLFIVAIFTIVGAVKLNQDGLLSAPGPLRQYSDPLFLATLIAGLALIVVSLLGCSVCKIETRLVPVAYGVLLVLIFLTYVICAATLGGVVNSHRQGL